MNYRIVEMGTPFVDGTYIGPLGRELGAVLVGYWDEVRPQHRHVLVPWPESPPPVIPERLLLSEQRG